LAILGGLPDELPKDVSTLGARGLGPGTGAGSDSGALWQWWGHPTAQQRCTSKLSQVGGGDDDRREGMKNGIGRFTLIGREMLILVVVYPS